MTASLEAAVRGSLGEDDAAVVTRWQRDPDEVDVDGAATGTGGGVAPRRGGGHAKHSKRGGGGTVAPSAVNKLAGGRERNNDDDDGADGQRRRCADCGADKTSRWRPIRDVDGSNERTVCKSCYQKIHRARNLAAGDNVEADGKFKFTCIKCGSNKSSDWHRCGDKTTTTKDGGGGYDRMCNTCYERGRREKQAQTGEEVQCPKCKTVSRRLLVANPSDKEAKCCQLCYHKERYRLKKLAESRSCVECSTETSTSWRRANGGGFMCVQCWRKNAENERAGGGAGGSSATGGKNNNSGGGASAASRVKHLEKTCSKCHQKKSSGQWRKIDGMDACSACYQQNIRKMKKVSCERCGAHPKSSIAKWRMNTETSGVCAKCTEEAQL